LVETLKKNLFNFFLAMNSEKEYETCFSMTRNSFSLSQTARLREKNSHSMQRSKMFAVCVGTKQSGEMMLPAFFILATSITT